MKFDKIRNKKMALILELESEAFKDRIKIVGKY